MLYFCTAKISNKLRTAKEISIFLRFSLQLTPFTLSTIAMIHLFLADGFEEIEALATLDILRRCGIDVTTVSCKASRTVMGAHNIPVEADTLFDAEALTSSDALILPGGMPGAKNLLEHEGLHNALLAQNRRGALVAAICAAPMVLGQHGILQSHKATCYPGFEPMLTGADVQSDYVVADGNIITGKGPAAAVEFGFTIASRFVSEDKVKEVRSGMLF